MRDRVALIRHAHLRQSPLAGELERVSHDAMHASIRVDLFLHCDLGVRIRAHAAARADVEPLRVLTKDNEVDLLAGAVLQRAQPIVKQMHGPIVGIEIELESGAEQNVSRMAVVGDARVAKRPNEDRVERSQRVIAAGGNGDAGPEVMVRAPWQLLEFDATESAKDESGRGDDFGANAIAGDDGNLARGQCRSLPLIIRKDSCIIRTDRCYALPLCMFTAESLVTGFGVLDFDTSTG